LEALLAVDPGLVAQGYQKGPSYSIEVLGGGGKFKALQVTDLFMDQAFDCKRVMAPSRLGPELIADMEKMACRAAAELNLNGIMDLEVIESGGELFILEIDARLPSQTPTAVFWSSGINMLELMGRAALEGSLPLIERKAHLHAVLYEHILVSPGRVQVLGEHIMAHAGPLSLIPGFWGADEALTNYRPGAEAWAATIIYQAEGRAEAMAKRGSALADLCKKFNLVLEDKEP
jgi:pyrrolysine biosynthesis protein PylC